MARIYTTLDSSEIVCPNCGAPLSKAICYTAQYAGTTKSVKREALTKTTTITSSFTDISRVAGGVCETCGKKKYASCKKSALHIFLIGLSLFIASLMGGFYIPQPESRFPGPLGQILDKLIPLSALAGLILIIAGIGFFIYSRKFRPFHKKPKFLSEEEVISELIADNMDRQKVPPGYTVLSMNTYNHLAQK